MLFRYFMDAETVADYFEMTDFERAVTMTLVMAEGYACRGFGIWPE